MCEPFDHLLKENLARRLERMNLFDGEGGELRSLLHAQLD